MQIDLAYKDSKMEQIRNKEFKIQLFANIVNLLNILLHLIQLILSAYYMLATY